MCSRTRLFLFALACAPLAACGSDEQASPVHETSASQSEAGAGEHAGHDHAAEEEPEPAALSEADAKARARLEQSKSLVRARAFGDAVRVLDVGLSHGPAPEIAAELVLQQGVARMREGLDAREERLQGVDPLESFRAAETHYSSVVEDHPDLAIAAEAAYYTGIARMMTGDARGAIELFRQAHGRYPDTDFGARALGRAGSLQSSLGESAAARRTYSEFLSRYKEGKEVEQVREYVREISIVDEPAPPLEGVRSMHGIVEQGGLEALRGNVVVLLFFATWCENCAQEMPAFRDLVHRWEPRGVAFVGVADPDMREGGPLEDYLARKDVRFLDVAIDDRRAAWPRYKVAVMPAMVVIDAKGTVRWRGHPVLASDELLAKLIEEAR